MVTPRFHGAIDAMKIFIGKTGMLKHGVVHVEGSVNVSLSLHKDSYDCRPRLPQALRNCSAGICMSRPPGLFEAHPSHAYTRAHDWQTKLATAQIEHPIHCRTLSVSFALPHALRIKLTPASTTRADTTSYNAPGRNLLPWATQAWPTAPVVCAAFPQLESVAKAANAPKWKGRTTVALETPKRMLAIGDILSATSKNGAVSLTIEVPDRVDIIAEHTPHHANDVMRHYHFFSRNAREYANHRLAHSSVPANAQVSIILKGVYGYELSSPSELAETHRTNCRPTVLHASRIRTACFCRAARPPLA